MGILFGEFVRFMWPWRLFQGHSVWDSYSFLFDALNNWAQIDLQSFSLHRVPLVQRELKGSSNCVQAQVFWGTFLLFWGTIIFLPLGSEEEKCFYKKNVCYSWWALQLAGSTQGVSGWPAKAQIHLRILLAWLESTFTSPAHFGVVKFVSPWLGWTKINMFVHRK